MAPEPLHYYVPGRVILTIEHHSDLGPSQLLELLVNVQTIMDAGISFLPPAESVRSFRRTNPAAPAAAGIVTSFVTAVVDAETPARAIEELLRFTDKGHPTVIETLDNIVVGRLMAFSPDFLAGGAPHQIVTGGPGGWPERVLPPAVPAVPNPAEFHFPGSPSLKQSPAHPNRGQGVRVILLDTVPTAGVLNPATMLPAHAANPLVTQVLAKLTIHRADPALFAPLEHNTLQGQRYLMPDHGLFVAGIINTIAPDAELHLIETLSQFGVGSVSTIASAVATATVLGRGNSSHVIVNCSGALGAWTPTHPLIGVDPLYDDELIYNILLEPLRILCGILEMDGVTVVAAAGNDSAGKPTREPVANPAGFSSVVSAGALPRNAVPAGPGTSNFPPAGYSNESDTKDSPGFFGLFAQTAKPGFMVFGGQPGPGNGVLSIYLDDLLLNDICIDDPVTQPYVTSASGWARWAGTSFAAPIISGICARLAGELGPGVTSEHVKAALTALRAGSVTPNEFVIEVIQP